MVSQFLLHHLFTLLPLFLPTGNSDLAADRDALLRFGSAVLGNTRRWNKSDPSPCSWKGVYCDNATRRVTEIHLPGFGISGQIPLNSIGNLTQLRALSLRFNSLSGPIPADLSSCTELRQLFLQENNFSGEIPATLFRLSNLIVLNLAVNNFSGKISPDINNIANLTTLQLEKNNLDGSIPATLFGLSNLIRLNLAVNNFSGQILPDINKLVNLTTLHLENNSFIGSIPDLNDLSLLQEFNVSYNKLNGSIPLRLSNFSSNSFLGNSLCGSPLIACPTGPTDRNDGNKLSVGAIAGIVIGSVSGLILILIVSIILWRNHRSRSQTTSRRVETSASPAMMPQDFDCRSPKPFLIREDDGLENGDSGRMTMARTGAVNIVQNGGLVFFGDGNVVFGLEELLRASAEVLGQGTLGTTYKAYLRAENEMVMMVVVVVVVVVKRLNNVYVPERVFREKVEGLGMLVHENLVPLKAYYYGREEKILVYDFLPMGSLSTLLHGKRGGDWAPLTWEIRSKIALGAACGIEYLHSLGPKFSHGNIKPSNILLTDNYDACVSEYGIVQLVSSTSALNLNGYCAPEVTNSHKISKKADVYSFGVLLLELLTGKIPTDAHWNEEGIDLPRWVRSVVQEKWAIDVFDPELLRYQNREEQLVQLLHLGIYCTSQHPNRRPSMVEVTRQIQEICQSR